MTTGTSHGLSIPQNPDPWEKSTAEVRPKQVVQDISHCALRNPICCPMTSHTTAGMVPFGLGAMDILMNAMKKK
jgi:hypothetical protein